MRKALLALLLAASVTPAMAQEKTFELKLSHWVPASHPLQKALEDWGAAVERDSGGTVKYKVFPAQQLGKAFDHYDMARDGIADVKGMKVRPAHATMANFITLLGGTNVQSSAPEVRDIIERGVADAVTFPWGSLVLFGIDKVTKYDMDAPLYVTTFDFVMNKDKYNQMSDKQKKAIDNNCNTEAAGRVGEPWGKFEDAGVEKVKAQEGHEVYKLTPEQTAQWKKASEPLVKT